MSQPPPNGNGNGEPPRLPRWFALRGPRPYWLAEYWALILGVIGTIAVFLNTVVAAGVESLRSQEWVNAVIAWVASLALFLQGRSKSVNRIAKWRQKVRDEQPPAKP